MAKIKLFFIRLWWRFLLRKKSKAELLEMLKNSNENMANLLSKFYASRVYNISELMVIIYDDDDEFPTSVRLAIGRITLAELKEPFSSMWQFNDASWVNTENGRVAYIMGIVSYLPDLKQEAEFIAHYYLYTYERNAFMCT